MFYNVQKDKARRFAAYPITILLIQCFFSQVCSANSLYPFRGDSAFALYAYILETKGLSDDAINNTFEAMDAVGADLGTPLHDDATGLVADFFCGPTTCGDSASARVDALTEEDFIQKATGNSGTVGSNEYVKQSFDSSNAAQLGSELKGTSIVANGDHFILKFNVKGDGVSHTFTFEGWKKTTGEWEGHLDQSYIGEYSWAEWESARGGVQNLDGLLGQLTSLLESPDSAQFRSTYQDLFLLSGGNSISKPNNLSLDILSIEVKPGQAITRVTGLMNRGVTKVRSTFADRPSGQSWGQIKINDNLTISAQRVNEYIKLKLDLSKDASLPSTLCF